MHTPNLADENFKKLAALFPNAVTETMGDDGKAVRAIDADVLRQEISATVVEGSHERYQFTWPDKKKSVVLANQPIAKTLRLDRAKSVGRDGTPGNIDTDNIYIEGDNLDALKLLQETYLGKIKMIYIDPPYNTGNDFIYNDEFKVDSDDWSQMSGDYDDNGNRMVQNTNSNGRFHTDWLNMIYPRLKIAKDLLSDDGVIFISISDDELSNLKSMTDEIFGAKNYCGDILWNSTKSVTNTSIISVSHTYNLIYFKNIEYFIENRSEFRLPEDGDGFENPDNDPRGPWKADPFQVGGWRPNQQYEILNPNTGVIYKPNNGCSWKNDFNKFQELLKDNRIIFGKTGKGGPQRKRFIWEAQERGKVAKTWWDDVETTTNGTQTIKKLFNGVILFDNPKPVEFIKKLLQLSTKSNSFVLDFFSGSATTAHAVMQLNAEDGGRRRFIMVQLPEKTDEKSEAYKAGYKTICDIGEERIRRAGRKILDERNVGVTPPPYLHQDRQLSLNLADMANATDSSNPCNDLDIGFRVFRVDSTNMRDVYYNPREFKQGELQLQIGNIKPDRTHEDLLVQVMLDMGIMLSSKIEMSTIDGKRVFSVADGYLIACFDDALTDDTVKAIAQKKPYYAVFRDSSMASDSVLTNFEQIFATYSPKTVRKVI